MLAGYGRYLNDNVRTEHLKCSSCRTRTHLTKIETDHDGGEVRSFACPHCDAVTTVRVPIRGEQGASVSLRGFDAC